MNTSNATTITIELEQSDGRRGGWHARTRVDGRPTRSSASGVGQGPSVQVEQPDVAWTPAPYEPGPCLCPDGLCDRDHENE